jgi:hypothetical protein
MATQVQIRKGTTAQHASFTGAVAELSVDTDKKTVVVHDGTTAGGVPLVTNTRTETITGTKTFSNAVLTTSSFTNNPTLSGGTANGVLYLNGSKVATSGSALVFDGKNFLVGAAASGSALSGDATVAAVRDNATTNVGSFKAIGGANQTQIELFATPSTIGLWSNGNVPMLFAVNNSEQMRLTSTGLGIGTSSPSQKLDVSGSARVTGSVYSTSFINTSNGTSYFTDASTGNGIYVGGSTATPANTLLFYTNAAERMRIDSSGNLGLGVTPSAWGGSGVKAFDMGAAGGIAGSSSDVGVLANAYYNGTNWIYKISSLAARYQILVGSGSHAWYTAASGTAGNAITFTQAMTLDASGNLGIGTSSPSSTSGFTTLTLNNATSGGIIDFQNNTSLVGRIYNNATNFYIYNQTANSLIFGTSGTERARIDSSGNLLVGTTSGSGKVRIEGGAGGTPAIYAYNKNATSGDYAAVFALGANNNNTSSFFLNCTEPGVANRFAIYGNGTYATLSDQRIKKNIESTRDGYLDDVLRLRVVKYNWLSQQDGEAKELGVIAQELEQVFPGLIQESQAEGSDVAYKQIKTSVLPFILLKAIQELKAEFDAYKASHP